MEISEVLITDIIFGGLKLMKAFNKTNSSEMQNQIYFVKTGRYSIQGPTFDLYCFDITLEICAICPRS